MVCGSVFFSIAAAALKTPTRNGYNAQGVNLTFPLHTISALTRALTAPLSMYRYAPLLRLNATVSAFGEDNTGRVNPGRASRRDTGGGTAPGENTGWGRRRALHDLVSGFIDDLE